MTRIKVGRGCQSRPRSSSAIGSRASSPSPASSSFDSRGERGGEDDAGSDGADRRSADDSEGEEDEEEEGKGEADRFEHDQHFQVDGHLENISLDGEELTSFPKCHHSLFSSVNVK